jgi:hypothetical protein
MPFAATSRSLLVLAAALAAGCAPGARTVLPAGLHSPYTDYSSAKYRDDALWLCRPDLPGDPCHGDLTATEIHPDGSRTIVPHVPAADPKVDCFYVYPTVDMRLLSGNHADLTHVEPMVSVLVAQAARFTEACAVYAPLYRQVTIGTYLRSASGREPYFATAFSDVEDAFLHYLGQYNHGRKVVLVGHSQGAEMVVRLVQQVFEHDPAMLERLLVAMPIGGQVEVPRGQTTGGTFATVPVCTRPEQVGCVVAFRSYRDGADVSVPWGSELRPGDDMVCVNPANVGGASRRWFSQTVLPVTAKSTGRVHGIEGVATPFVLYRDLYAGQCREGPGGFDYLAVSELRAPGDVRVSPLDLGSFWLDTSLGLHILDMQFPQGDLIDLVARKAAALP